MKKQLFAALSATTLGFVSTVASAAVVVTIGGVSVLNQGQTSAFANQAGFTTFDFNAMPLGPAALVAPYSGNGHIVVGSLSGQYAAPQTPGNPNTSPYLSVPRATAGVTEVSINAPSLSNYFGLWWGSIDNYNSITFFNGNTQVATYGGAFIRTVPNPDLTPGTQTEAAYVNFAFTGGYAFDRIVLASSQFALESDNHVFGAAVIPVPGAAALMLSGLLGMVFAARRERKGLRVA